MEKYSYRTLCEQCSTIVTYVANSHNNIHYYDQLDATVYNHKGQAHKNPLVPHKCTTSVDMSPRQRMAHTAQKLANALKEVSIGQNNSESIRQLEKLAYQTANTSSTLYNIRTKILNTYALGRQCPACNAPIGVRCFDRSTSFKEHTTYPHQERLPENNPAAHLTRRHVKTLETEAKKFTEQATTIKELVTSMKHDKKLYNEVKKLNNLLDYIIDDIEIKPVTIEYNTEKQG